MEAALPIPGGGTIPGTELSLTVSRAGGPGGQHVNKTSSRVSLRWTLATTTALTPAQRARVAARLAGRLTRGGDVLINVDESRSQLRNRALARARLALLVSAALVVAPPRKPTRPSRRARARRLDAKHRRSAIKRLRRRPDRET